MQNTLEKRLVNIEVRLSKYAISHTKMVEEFKECKKALEKIYKFHAEKLLKRDL